MAFDLEAVDEIERRLDDYGTLDTAPSQLVVIGGAAMAAFGLKHLHSTDIDIVVTCALDRKGEFGATMATRYGVWEPWHNGSWENRQRTGITVLSMPMDDSYPVTSDELIAEMVIPAGRKYGYLPLSKIMEFKLALANSDTYEGDKEKHRCDASWIADFIYASAFVREAFSKALPSR